MKMPAREKDECCAAPCESPDAPRYPWGLSLSLDNDSLEKLGLTELPALGAETMLVARVKVTSVSSNESEHGASKNVSLQITAMALGKQRKETAALMFGG